MEKQAILKVLAGAVLISFSGVYVKLAHVGPGTSAFYRVFLGSVFFILIAAFKKERLWKSLPYFGMSVVCGFVFAADLFVWHKSIHHIGPGLATILANFQVFLLGLFGVAVLKEKISMGFLLSVPLAMTGLFMIVGLDWGDLGQGYKLGLFFGLLTALCYAAYVLTLRKLQSQDNPLSPTANLTVVSIVTAVFLGIAAWCEGESFAIPDTQTLVALLSYGFFSQVIGWILITRGLPRMKASLAGLLLLLQPSLAFVWDMLFFARPTTPVNIAGAVLAISAIYMGTRK